MQKTFFISYANFIIKVCAEKVSQAFFYKLDIENAKFQEVQELRDGDKMLESASRIYQMLWGEPSLKLTFSMIEREKLEITEDANKKFIEFYKDKKNKDYNKLFQKDFNKNELYLALWMLRPKDLKEEVLKSGFYENPELEKVLKEDLTFWPSLAGTIYYAVCLERQEAIKKFKPS